MSNTSLNLMIGANKTLKNTALPFNIRDKTGICALSILRRNDCRSIRNKANMNCRNVFNRIKYWNRFSKNWIDYLREFESKIEKSYRLARRYCFIFKKVGQKIATLDSGVAESEPEPRHFLFPEPEPESYRNDAAPQHCLSIKLKQYYYGNQLGVTCLGIFWIKVF
jgi:hypothetical protein